MSDPRYEILPWEVEILTSDGPQVHPASRIESMPANTFFAVRGALSASLPYLHLVRRGASRQLPIVSVLCVARADLLDAGEAAGEGRIVRLPQVGAYLSLDVDGTVCAVAAERVLAHREMALLLGGREPPPQQADERSA